MSFSGSARRAGDPRRHVGQRVTALHQCLDAFAPFGFEGTRALLLHLTGARPRRWTAEQVDRSLALLADARSSWLRHERAAQQAGRAGKRRDGGRSPGDGEWRVAWLRHWLEHEGGAQQWAVAGLGPCPDCRHPLVLHAAACLDCLAAGRAWDACCHRPLPAGPPPASRWRRLLGRRAPGT